jgi:Membrane-bound metallopeptidase
LNEYKSVSKYLSKKREKFNFKRFISKFLIRVMICIILFLVGLIVLKYDKSKDGVITKYLTENNINFASINKIYQKYLGNILPFQGIAKENTEKVFNEKISYTEANIYKDGVKLTVDDNYLVPIVESGVVVFLGEKEDFGKTVIIQQVNGVDVWYGNLTNINVNIYDYVSKGEFLALVEGNALYMQFVKDGKYLDYKEYLK